MQVSGLPKVIPRSGQTSGGGVTDAGRKSALYREVNLATEKLLAEYGSDDPGHFLCECDDADCARQVELRRAEFESLRLSGRRLVSDYCSSIEK